MNSRSPVAVADDNRGATDPLVDILGQTRCKTVAAYAARESVVACAGFAPAPAILDVQMPLLEGWDESVYEKVCVPLVAPIAAAVALPPSWQSDFEPAVALDSNKRDQSSFPLQLISWVKLIGLHDARSLTSLHDACAERVYAHALRVVQRPCLAEEVVEDCFLQVWREAPLFDAARGSVLAWLMTITRSRAIDLMRRQATVAKHETSLDGVAASHPICTAPGPIELLEFGQRSLYLDRLLYSLNPVQRQILSLVYLGGLTQGEVARQFDMPLGTVKSHVRRALASLKSQCRPRGLSLDRAPSA